MPEVLTDDQIAAAVRDLPGWEARPGALYRAVTAPTFMAGIQLVVEVAKAAERLNHHPDIDIRWTTVSFSLTTHSAGGVTRNDVELAREINSIAAANLGPEIAGEGTS